MRTRGGWYFRGCSYFQIDPPQLCEPERRVLQSLSFPLSPEVPLRNVQSFERIPSWDLKGSTQGRYRKNTGDPNGKDQDWIACRAPWPIFLDEDTYRRVMQALKNDVTWLQGAKQVDYSLALYELTEVVPLENPPGADGFSWQSSPKSVVSGFQDQIKEVPRGIMTGLIFLTRV